MPNRVRVTKLSSMKRAGEAIVCITAYDYASARLIDQAQIPVILVGDSLGQVVLGHDSTVPVTMGDILHHTKAVVRGSKRALVVADLPFMSYRVDDAETMRNAAKLLQEGGAQAVKLEGGTDVADSVRRLVDSGVAVMGHIGLQPQSVNATGGYRARGKTRQEAGRLLADALALEDAGAFAVVLELVTADLAEKITARLSIPTIGIGAGPACDGQIQVLTDVLGLGSHMPRHSKQFADLNQVILAALRAYAAEVTEGSFPGDEHSIASAPVRLREAGARH